MGRSMAQSKNTGITRKIDQLGRVVLPSELRRQFGIREGDLIEIYVDAGRIVLAKLQERCVLCSTAQDLREIAGKFMCVNCMRTVAAFPVSAALPSPDEDSGPGTAV